jgi:hypothetical protein
MVVTAFTMMVGWLWGIGAFNPKNSQHAHPPYLHHEDEHEETAIVAVEAHHEAAAQEPKPFAILMQDIWKVLTYSVLFFLIFWGLAKIPGGFFLQVASEPEADAGAFGMMTLPFVGEVSQIVVFIGFVAFMIISLLLFAGVLGIFFYMSNHEVAVAHETEPTLAAITPPAPMRWLGRGAKGLARALRNGLPRFFGMR